MQEPRRTQPAPPPPQVCTLLHSGRLKVKRQNDQFYVYDFDLRAEQLYMQWLDLNAFWLCAGRQVRETFAGAWLLTVGDSVISELKVVQRTEFDRRHNKTYARVWFVAQDDSAVPLLRSPALRVRVAVRAKSEPSDLYFLASGRHRLEGAAQYEGALDGRWETMRFMGPGVLSDVRWHIDMIVQPPAPQPQQPPQQPPEQQQQQQSSIQAFLQHAKQLATKPPPLRNSTANLYAPPEGAMDAIVSPFD